MHLPNAFQKKELKRVCSAALLPAALLAMSLAANAQSGSPATSRLTVEVTGIKNASGEVCVSLFSGSADFPNNAESLVEEQCAAAIETNPETVSPPELQSEVQPELQQGENTAIKPIPELAAIPEPVMDNIIEGLANNASNPDASAEVPDTEVVAADTDPTTGAEVQGDVPITQAILAITFSDIAPGTYAVSVIHDENEDGELNTGTFGIPTEGFGFSRNPEIRTGAPDFSEAAIIVIGAEATTQVELIYY